MVLDSWLDSVNSDDIWKWFHLSLLLVISQRRPRSKTNALIVSLAVADFCAGLSLFLHFSSVDVVAIGLDLMPPGRIL